MNATTNEMTLTDKVKELGITAEIEELDPPFGEEWAKQGWNITLRFQGRSMNFNFYGGGASKEPSVDDGVWCMALESGGVRDHSFSEWASEFGYSDDSRKAHATYLRVKRNAKRFDEFIASESLLDELYILACNY